jgi:hypothetical protein
MFGMSVNDVPGWLVAMAPSGIGVPVAFTPGLVPHCDVLTALPLGAADAVSPDELLEPPLLHPAAAIVPMTAASATTARMPGLCFRVPT